MMMARPKWRLVSPITPSSMAPSRRCRCQSSGRRMVNLVMGGASGAESFPPLALLRRRKQRRKRWSVTNSALCAADRTRFRPPDIGQREALTQRIEWIERDLVQAEGKAASGNGRNDRRAARNLGDSRKTDLEFRADGG